MHTEACQHRAHIYERRSRHHLVVTDSSSTRYPARPFTNNTYKRTKKRVVRNTSNKYRLETKKQYTQTLHSPEKLHKICLYWRKVVSFIQSVVTAESKHDRRMSLRPVRTEENYVSSGRNNRKFSTISCPAFNVITYLIRK